MLENIVPDAEEDEISFTSTKPRKQTLSFVSSPTAQIKETVDKEAQPVAECNMKEMMNMLKNLSSEVINLQQDLYLKDIMIKNLYLR